MLRKRHFERNVAMHPDLIASHLARQHADRASSRRPIDVAARARPDQPAGPARAPPRAVGAPAGAGPVLRRCVDERAPTGHDGTMTTPSEDTNDTAGAKTQRERRRLTDAKEMRALAHPTRVAAIELLSREGTMTATQLGELLDESPANMSFHLRTLAKYGFVEEAPGGTGRERPWSRVGQGNSLGARQRRRGDHVGCRRPRPQHGPAGVRPAQRVGAEPVVVRQGVAEAVVRVLRHDVPDRRPSCSRSGRR